MYRQSARILATLGLFAGLAGAVLGATPVPRPTPRDLAQGLALYSIIASADEVEAYLIVDGRPEPVQVGDIIKRQGFAVTVREINPGRMTVTIADNKGQRAVLALPVRPGVTTPVIRGRRLTTGLGLHGVISDEDGVKAYITVDSRMETLQVGDRIPREGFAVTVKAIDPHKLTVTIADDKGHKATLYQLPPAPPLLRRRR